MITKAIIEQIESDGYHYKVRIPILHKIENAPGATPSEELPTALVCYAPGCKPNLHIGDVVYVGFENNQYSEPVIIGMLLNDSYKESSASIIADSIDASVNVNLPQSNVNFGDISLSTIIDSASTASSSATGEGLTKAEYELLLAKIQQLLVQQFPDTITKAATFVNNFPGNAPNLCSVTYSGIIYNANTVSGTTFTFTPGKTLLINVGGPGSYIEINGERVSQGDNNSYSYILPQQDIEISMRAYIPQSQNRVIVNAI